MKPFKRNDNDGVDRTAEGDIIEGVEGLGEDVGIDRTGLVKWPLKHYNLSCILAEKRIHFTSDKGIVEDDKADEDAVKA